MDQMYSTQLFCDIYDKAEDFINDWHIWLNGSKLNDLCIDLTDNYISGTYFLLMGRYGTTPIANFSIEQFKLKLFNTVFMYGPSWSKKLKIQSDIRNLSVDDIREGSKYISNTALNPDQEPDSTIDDEVQYINQQSVSKNKNGILSAYSNLWETIRTDVSSEYINRFKNLFRLILIPEDNYIYQTYDEEEEI